MNHNYFSKVESKYVFNLSLIFWHLFVAISSLVVIVSLVIFLWSLIPASKNDVEKKTYPTKRSYPAPVKVALNELQLEVTKEEAPPDDSERIKIETVVTQQPVEDTKGKEEYESSLNTLKTLIPPSKYSWAGSGYWTYPFGERYWTFYKQEKYRKWNITEPGIEDKLKSSYRTTNAKDYPDKKQIIDGYISIVKLLSEEKRLSALLNLINNIGTSVSHNINVYQSLINVVSIMSQQENSSYLGQLTSFAKTNPVEFIDFVGTIIDKFDTTQRIKIIDNLIKSYYNYFSKNLAKQKEATDLFVPLLKQIKGENHPKALMQYYGVYLNKNYERNNAIAQIEMEYQRAINEIENQYNLEQIAAQQEYFSDKMSKDEYRLKSLAGIGGGILFIVLVAVVLVFFSIQRSVKKIEEKISSNGENVNPVV